MYEHMTQKFPHNSMQQTSMHLHLHQNDCQIKKNKNGLT